MINLMNLRRSTFGTLLMAATMLAPVSEASAASKLTGSFVATSTTSMSISGDLVITGKSIDGAVGIAVTYRSAGSISASTVVTTTGESMASLLVVPAKTKIKLLSVSSETMASKNVNGGFCGLKTTTKYLAVAVSGKKLAIAAFSAKPGLKKKPSGLCGTYVYERK
jgi:hypothetical protein